MSLEHLPQRETGTAAHYEKAFLEDLLTVTQVSEIIGRSVSTLEKDRLEGGGPPYVKMGRLVRYRPADVRAWLSERVRRSTSEGAAEAPLRATAGHDQLISCTLELMAEIQPPGQLREPLAAQSTTAMDISAVAPCPHTAKGAETAIRPFP
jgi:predicted DNA-binding transcriptional regulator AlpA